MRQRIIGSNIIEYGEATYKMINEQIKPTISVMGTLLDDIEWQGNAKNSYFNYYKNIMFEVKKIPNVLEVYLKFLSSTMETYEDLMHDLKTSFDKLDDELANEGDLNE